MYIRGESAYSDIKKLGILRPYKSIIEILMTWFLIFLIILIYYQFNTLLVYLISIILIGSRQYALLILLHDASHFLINRNKRINDHIAIWYLAAPCGSTFLNSRRLHLLHHKKLGTGNEDPDYFYYSIGEPSPKNSKFRLLLHFTKLIFGYQIIHTLFKESDKVVIKSGTTKFLARAVPLLRVFFVQLIIFSIFFYFGKPFGYFSLWILPLLTMAVLLNGLRVFAEHSNSTYDEFPKNKLLISYASNPIESFFLAPFHMNYHAEHHLYPFVPHYNLSRLRRIILEDKKSQSTIELRSYYLRFFRDFLNRPIGVH